jgi:acyl carrier protein
LRQLKDKKEGRELEINNELKQVIAETLGLPISEVTSELAAGTVDKWDSLGHLNLILNIEGNFKVKFKTEQISELVIVGKIHEELKSMGLF